MADAGLVDIPLENEAADERRMLSLAERVDRLQAQLDEMNDMLRRHLNSRRRRRLSVAAQLASFRKQARKLANYAPF